MLHIHWNDWCWRSNTGHLIWKANSLEKTDAGNDWGQEEKGTTEDETVGWHHWLNGHELEQILGDSEGQGNLACFSPWDRTEPDTTEQQQYYLLTIQISQSFMLCPLFVFIGLHIVFSCTEQFQLHATNSGKILFIFILLQLFSSFPCYGFLDTPII